MSEEKSFVKRLLTETWPAKMAKDALSALMLPGDVYQGKVSMYGEPAAPKRDPGYVESAGRGALQGASFGFDDELRGASAAALAGLPEPIKQVINTLPGNLPAKTVAGIARLLYESYQGEPGEATKAYDLTVANERKDLANAREQYPVTTTLGEVGGAIAMPVGGLLGGATLPVRMGRGAGVGAVSGALYGAGQGESLEGRAAGAAIGGVGGALIGGLAPPIIEGGVAAARAIASKPINAVRSAINPEGAAQRAVGRAYQESVKTDPTAINRLAPQELTPGGPAVVMDTLGNEGRNLARAAEANSLRAGVSNKVAKREYPIDEITKKAIDDYNRMLPSEKDQYYKWAGEAYDYQKLGRKEADDIFGDDLPHDLSKIFSSGDDAVMITRGENVEYVPSKSAQTYDEFIRDVVSDEGGITKAASLDDIYNNLGKQVEAGYPAASEAAKRIAKEMGWDVTRGVRYFDISKGDISKHVRVSDHGQLTRSNPNARTPDINLAPGAHDYNDYIDILKKYGLAGASASPLAALMAGQSQGELQQ